jgi:hypothetical protein
LFYLFPPFSSSPSRFVRPPAYPLRTPPKSPRRAHSLSIAANVRGIQTTTLVFHAQSNAGMNTIKNKKRQRFPLRHNVL